MRFDSSWEENRIDKVGISYIFRFEKNKRIGRLNRVEGEMLDHVCLQGKGRKVWSGLGRSFAGSKFIRIVIRR